MDIEFTFNHTSKITLKPANSKDKQLIQLCHGVQGKQVGWVDTVNVRARVVGENGDLVIEFVAKEVAAAVDHSTNEDGITSSRPMAVRLDQ